MPNNVAIIWTAVGKNIISGMRTNPSIKMLLIVSIVFSPDRPADHTRPLQESLIQIVKQRHGRVALRQPT
jgi:hypothetical protein